MQRINGKQIRYTLIEVKAMFFLERRHEYKTTVGPVTTLHKHRETRKTRYSKGVIGNASAGFKGTGNVKFHCALAESQSGSLGQIYEEMASDSFRCLAEFR